MPAMQRARGGAAVMSWPSKWTVPLSGCNKSGDEIEQRRFAGAVRPDDAERLAARDFKLDTVDGFE